jgi:hypothetical protein
MDTQKLRELLDKRDQIDADIVALIVTGSTRKPQKCSRCGSTEHNARACLKAHVE